MANIAINIVANAGGGATNSAIDDLARRLDTAMQYAAQKMTTSFDAAFARMNQGLSSWATAFVGHMARIEATVDRLIQKMGTLGQAQQRATPQPISMNMAGWNLTGAYSQTYTSAGMTGRTQYQLPNGAMAWVNDDMTKATINQKAVDLIAQRQAQLAANRDTGINRFQGWVGQYGLRMTSSTDVYNPRADTSSVRESWSSGDPRSWIGRFLGRGYTQYTGTIDRGTGASSMKQTEVEATGLTKSLSTAKDAIVAFASSIFSLQSIGGAINRFLIQPFRDAISTIFTATEEYRRFENSISGVAGGQARARGIDQALVMASRSSPMTMAQLHEAGVGLTFTQYGAARVSGASVTGAAGAINDYALLLQQLSQLAPEQGVGGAQIAVREALAGNFQSARRRLNTSPELIAQSLRKPGGGTYTLAEITGNQSLTMQAFQEFAKTWIGNEPIEGQKNLFSNAREKLGDSMTQIAAKIGNAGVYDKIVDRFRAMTDAINKFGDSEGFKNAAKNISDGMVKVFDAITDSILSFAQRLTGTSDVNSMLGKVGDVLGRAVDKIGDLATHLPQIASWIGEIMNAVVSSIGTLWNKINSRLDDPIGIRSGFNGAAVGMTLGIGHMLGFGGSGPTNIPGSAGAGSGAQMSISDAWNSLQFESLGGLTNPISRQRAFRDYIGGLQTAGNYRPLAMGMINTVANGAQIFQMQSAEGSTFEFPMSPFSRASANAASIPGSIRSSLTTNGDTASYAQLLRAVRADDTNVRNLNAVMNGIMSSPTDMPFLGGLIGNIQSGAPKNWAEILSQAMGNTGGRLKAIQDMPGSLGYQSANVAGALSQQLSSVAPQYRQTMLDRILLDANGLIPAIAKALQLGPEEIAKMRSQFQKGISEHPDFFIGASRDAAMASLSAQGTYGSYSVGTGFTGPLTPRDYMSRQAGTSRMYSTKYREAADAEYAAHGNTELYASLSDSAAKELFNAKKIEHDLDSALQSIETFSTRSRDAIESGIGDALYGLITHTGKVSDAFKSMANSILKSFSDMTAQLLMQGIFGADFLKPNQGQGGVGLGGLGGIVGGVVSMLANADGGILPGSYIPFQAFSNGGVARSTTLGLVAEAGQPEAVVPLPNGRSIPVEMRGGGGGGRVFVVNSKQEASAMGYNPSQDDLVNIVADNIYRGGKIHKAINAKKQR